MYKRSSESFLASDLEEAAKWYSMAAEQGNEDAASMQRSAERFLIRGDFPKSSYNPSC